MKYVGIKNSLLKSTLIKKWKKGKILEIATADLIARDCDRHLKIIDIFREMDVFSQKLFSGTEYYKYQLSTRKLSSSKKAKKATIRKIKNFYKLYLSLQLGYNYKLGYIKVTTDGARLDGSHRASILHNIGVPTVKVVVLDWRDFFTVAQLRDVRKHLARQKKLFVKELVEG